MTPRRSRSVSQLLGRAITGPSAAGCDDRELLRRFLEHRDDAAFEAIVRRHGRLVLDVCRGVLRSEADAEDAFQAVFLVLAHKGGGVREAGSLASWLHGVAFRTACRAREAFARRARHTARVAPRAPTREADELAWREVRQIVHEELGAISERYRSPLLLCYLEGMTQDDAAALLGVARSTLKVRLERGRALLRARLARRGLGPAAVALAAAWPFAARAGPPLSLITTTVESATSVAAGGASASAVSAEVGALVKGGLSSMKLVSAKAAITLVLGVGTSVLAIQTLRSAGAPAARAQGVHSEADAERQAAGSARDDPDGQAAESARLVLDEKAKAERAVANARAAAVALAAQGAPGRSRDGGGDEAALRGPWTAVGGESAGKEVLALRGYRMTFGDGKVTVQFGGETKEGTFKLDPKAEPKAIDLGLDGGTGLGIYRLEGDRLQLCIAEAGKAERPTKFATEEGGRTVLMTMKRGDGADRGQKGGPAEPAGSPQLSILREQLKALEARNKALERQFESARESIDGVLTKVDAGKNTVSIGLKGTKLVLEDAPLSGDASFHVGDRAAAIADLQPGMYVVARLKTDGDRTVVAAVTVSKPGE